VSDQSAIGKVPYQSFSFKFRVHRMDDAPILKQQHMIRIRTEYFTVSVHFTISTNRHHANDAKPDGGPFRMPFAFKLYFIFFPYNGE
jgi:hypothetical protein